MIINKLKSPAGTGILIGLPDDYETSGKSYPLIQFHHGIGERGSNLDLLLKYGPLKQLKDGVVLSKDFVPIVVMPQVPSGQTGGKTFGLEVLNYITDQYKAHIDLDRIYLGWLSMGGYTGWPMVEDPTINKRIAAYISICAASNNPANAKYIVNEGLPGWACHAPNDDTVPYANTKEMVDAINELAQDELCRLYDTNVYGHSVWNKFLDPALGVYDWLKYQKVSKRKASLEQFKSKTISFIQGL